jgi:hypothetical protein
MKASLFAVAIPASAPRHTHVWACGPLHRRPHPRPSPSRPLKFLKNFEKIFQKLYEFFEKLLTSF